MCSKKQLEEEFLNKWGYTIPKHFYSIKNYFGNNFIIFCETFKNEFESIQTKYNQYINNICPCNSEEYNSIKDKFNEIEGIYDILCESSVILFKNGYKIKNKTKNKIIELLYFVNFTKKRIELFNLLSDLINNCKH